MKNVKMTRPIPLIDEASRPYWEAANRHEFVIQKCEDCNVHIHPPGFTCIHCGGNNLSWTNLGNEVYGTIYSYIISYRPYLPGFEDKLPLPIAVVELEKFPEVKIYANVIHSNVDDVKIGQRVKMVWEKLNDTRSIPQWEIVS